MAMRVVAISGDGGDLAERAAALAQAAGVSLYEAQRHLVTRGPRVLATYGDRVAAVRVAEALSAAGFTPFVLDDEAERHARFEVRGFELDGRTLKVSDRPGATAEVPFAKIAVLVRGVRALGPDEREPFLEVHAAGTPVLAFYERRLQYDGLHLERQATAAANFGSFMHQGQICMSVEKILVHEKIFDAFLQRFVERAAKLKVGDPGKDKSHIIGPLINDQQAAKVKGQIDDAVAKGARIALGGKVNGRFVEPTILVDVTPDMLVYQDETFGPVVPVIPFRSDDEAIAMANDTEYGLSSGVITRDEQRALAIARRLETGMCHINCSSVNDEPHAPFGGSKASGQGRHGGRWATETFTETRWITLERGGRPFPPMF